MCQYLWLFRKSRDRNLSDRILMLPGPNKVARFTQPAEEPYLWLFRKSILVANLG